MKGGGAGGCGGAGHLLHTTLSVPLLRCDSRGRGRQREGVVGLTRCRGGAFICASRPTQCRIISRRETRLSMLVCTWMQNACVHEVRLIHNTDPLRPVNTKPVLRHI